MVENREALITPFILGTDTRKKVRSQRASHALVLVHVQDVPLASYYSFSTTVQEMPLHGQHLAWVAFVFSLKVGMKGLSLMKVLAEGSTQGSKMRIRYGVRSGNMLTFCRLNLDILCVREVSIVLRLSVILLARALVHSAAFHSGNCRVMIGIVKWTAWPGYS